MKMVEINGKEYALEFTFESMEFMEDFDVTEIEELTKKPLKLIRLTRELLYGALNHNPDGMVYTSEETRELVKQASSKGELAELFEILCKLLEESDFFKNLQGEMEE